MLVQKQPKGTSKVNFHNLMADVNIAMSLKAHKILRKQVLFIAMYGEQVILLRRLFRALEL